MKINNLIIFVLFLSLLINIYAYDDYSNFKSCNFYVESKIKVHFINSDVSDLDELNIKTYLIPKNTYRQSIKFFDCNTIPYNLERINKNKDFCEFELKNVYKPQDFTLIVRSNLSTKKDYKQSGYVKFPEEVDDSFKPFLESNEYIQSNNSQIIDLANKIAQNQDDVFVVLYKIAEYISKNIKYDLGQKNTIESSVWVLNNKKGVCDEFAILFIALARSLGIPARYVSGLAYSNLDEMKGFGAHAWAEAYLKGYGWIPFDIPFKQYGYVDSSHIVISKNSQGYLNSVEMSYIGDKIKVKTKTQWNVKTISCINETEHNDFSVKIKYDHISLHSYNELILKINNYNNYYKVYNVRFAKVEGLKIFNKSFKVLLKPFSSITKIIKLKVDLQDGFIYRLPVFVIVNNQNKTVYFNASDQGLNVDSVDNHEEIINNENNNENNNKHVIQISDLKGFIFNSSYLEFNIKNKDNKPLNAKLCCNICKSCIKLDLKIMQSKKYKINTSVRKSGIYYVNFYLIDNRSETQFNVNVSFKENPKCNIYNINKKYSNKTLTLSFVISCNDLVKQQLILFSNKLQKTYNFTTQKRKMIINIDRDYFDIGNNDIILEHKYKNFKGNVIKKYKINFYLDPSNILEYIIFKIKNWLIDFGII